MSAMQTSYMNRLRAGAATRPRAEIPTATVENGVATIRLYDIIDSWGEYWGVNAKEFVAILDELQGVNEIQLRINSPGGDVFEAIAIMNALRAHSARVVAIVDGIAASAASFIAASADELVMSKNSELMIHDAWGVCVGNATDMTAMAAVLDHLSDNIASVYAEKAGADTEAWRALMTAETWLSADEAVAAGVADRVDGDSAAIENSFDLSLFAHAGRAAAPEPKIPAAKAKDVDDEASTEAELKTKMRVRAHALAAHQ